VLANNGIAIRQLRAQLLSAFGVRALYFEQPTLAETDCVAGVVGLELPNPSPSYPIGIP
jgi:hypothetical protein